MSSTTLRIPARRGPVRRPLDFAREAAERSSQATHRFLADLENQPEVERALRIRAVEDGLYTLFGKGKLHGTIHTCIGQEFSGALLGKYLEADDLVTSNHRCHGHFIGATGNWHGLIDEIVGNEDGVCAGIGSSQHLWARNFISNGQQGGLLPVGAGVALDRKLKKNGGVTFSFIGEGTLGEGVVYETLNLDALWSLPHVVICENNFYSQSTAQEQSVAGSILERAKAFGLAAFSANTWDLHGLDHVIRDAIIRARSDCKPTFILLATYRLNPHSKGDDQRAASEIEWFRKHDPVTIALADYPNYADRYKVLEDEVAIYIETALAKPSLKPFDYFRDQLPRVSDSDPANWAPTTVGPDQDKRLVQQLNLFYGNLLTHDKRTFFLGEDIDDPYGGAFKVSKGFKSAFPLQVSTTPISEAAITGIGIGMAISGRRPLVEIMFGDFITYAFDQIINNASKFFHMYNGNISCPVIVRTPMGGRRGYGPTHSQSLERFLVGIDNCCTLSLNSLTHVSNQISGLSDVNCPIVLLENKSDYAVKTFIPPKGYIVESNGSAFPTIRIRPQSAKPTITLFSFGGMARFIANGLVDIFERADVVPELIVPTSLYPLNLNPISASVKRTGLIVTVEEGAAFSGIGGEVIAQLHDCIDGPFLAARVSGKPTPIPSAPSLEAAALPSINDICDAIIGLRGGNHD